MKKKSNIGLAASRFQPLSRGFWLTKKRKLNKGRLLGLVLVLVLIGTGIKLFASASAGQAKLRKGECIHRGDALKTSSKKFAARFQSDSNFVLIYTPSNIPVWASGTNGSGGTAVCLGNDGNLVMLKPGRTYPVVVWQTHSEKMDVTYLQVKDKNYGSLALYKANGKPVWSSKIKNPGGGLYCVNPLKGLMYSGKPGAPAPFTYPWRTDRGVDFQMRNGDPVRTMCSGVVRSTKIPGWGHDNAYIEIKFDSYPVGIPEVKGWCMFYAEDIIPSVAVGQRVFAGDKIGTAHYPGGTYSQEWGWSTRPGTPSTAKASDGGATPGGRAMTKLMRHLGAAGIGTDANTTQYVAGTKCP
jgi:hypothetical protein